MKPELEFFDTQTLAFTAFVPDDPNIKSQKRSLSIDPDTGDETSILYHPPGDEWGWTKPDHDREAKKLDDNGSGLIGEYVGGTHVYWEEVYILEGQLWDGNSSRWYKAGSYCCRPPGMFHGPFKAHHEEGCRELVFIRHTKS